MLAANLLTRVTSHVYDFENRLVQRSGVKIVYDGDGNRVKETVATVTTSYLVADQNLTGYAQVRDERQGGAVVRRYSSGTSTIKGLDVAPGPNQVSTHCSAISQGESEPQDRATLYLFVIDSLWEAC